MKSTLMSAKEYIKSFETHLFPIVYSPGGGGVLPYKSDGGARRTF